MYNYVQPNYFYVQNSSIVRIGNDAIVNEGCNFGSVSCVSNKVSVLLNWAHSLTLQQF